MEHELFIIHNDDGSTPMHVSGVIVLSSSDTIDVPNVLLDTGAVSANYMSTAFYNKYISQLEPLSMSCYRSVRLGDSETIKPITKCVCIDMKFVDDPGYDSKGGTIPKVHNVNLKCNIFDCGHDIIVGLPSLLTDCNAYFMHIMEHAKLNADYEEHVMSAFSLSNVELMQNGALFNPFPNVLDEEPEEVDCEIPVNFGDALHFMELGYDDSVKEYLDMFDEHIDPDFRASTRVVELMKTKGVEVFVPRNWEGINGIPPLELVWKSDPPRMKPQPRPINPKLFEQCKKEIERLKKYHLLPSTSDVASCLVVAPKATPPYIRFCTDLTRVNKFIEIGHYPIPDIPRSLEKIITFRYFVDLDMTNSFHQFLLAKKTRERLSVVTPFGQFEPKFLPEGVGPASGILQKYMQEIFSPFEEWSIVCFDNFLLLAHDYDDAYRKLELFINMCIKRNIFLKFAKSWLGMREVSFFGYICRYGSYALSTKRVQAVQDIPFPRTIKQMQSFLGMALFFQRFVANYSTLAAPLTDMTHKDFAWHDPSLWTADYFAHFLEFKTALSNACRLFYPDYSLVWVLRTDASEVGGGAVLFQIAKNNDNQPLQFLSKKFSPQAMRWKTIEQECYIIYFAVFTLAYYLRCKQFILETDHRNLIWMESSLVPKIMRWHIFLQSFNILLRHIEGRKNLVADLLSRAFDDIPASEELSYILAELREMGDEFTELHDVLAQVHGGRAGHLGVKRTWTLLNKKFPGHGISVKTVEDYINECPVCQKDRAAQIASIPPLVKTLHKESIRSCIGFDTLQLAEDIHGMRYLLVIINFFTKYAVLYAVKNKDAITTAQCIFNYTCTYGLFHEFRSDPGSDFTSEVIAHLVRWLGPTHTLTLVDNPQADGVEGTNKQILRHIKALCMDERVKDRWSEPTILPIVQLLVNEYTHSETGYSPLQATFGDIESIYYNIPDSINEPERTHKYILSLQQNLRDIRDASAKYQQLIRSERTTNQLSETANRYQPGDYVLYLLRKSQLPDKLSPRNKGPYQVVKHIDNVVTVRNMIHGNLLEFNPAVLKIFVGSHESAYKMAQLDNDQYEINIILGYSGDPNKRSMMDFYVKFVDGTKQWLPYSEDLSSTQQFEAFCQCSSELQQLLITATAAKSEQSRCRKTDIHFVQPGDIVYVNIRSWGSEWYKNLDLPDKFTTSYVTKCEYGEFCGSKSRPKLKIKAIFPDLQETFEVDNVFVHLYGRQALLEPSQVLLTPAMIAEYKLYDSKSSL